MNCLYYIIIISIIFQDLPICNYIGEFGKTITGFLAILFLLFYILSKEKINLSKEIIILIKLEIYLIGVNIIALFYYFTIKNGQVLVLGENIFLKAIKSNLYFVVIIVFLIFLNNCCKILNIKQILFPFMIGFYTMFFILLIEVFIGDSALGLIHNFTGYTRVRLATPEASWTSTLIVSFFLLTYYYYSFTKNMLGNLLSSIIFLIFILISDSKAMLTTLFLALIVCFFFFKIKFRTRLTIVILSGIIMYFILPKIYEMFISDINEFTSVVTRGYTTFVGFAYAIEYPFGMGNGVYLFYFPRLLEKYLFILNNFNNKFNLQEIVALIFTDSDKGMAPKTALSQYAMYWGIVGSIYFGIFFRRIYKKVKNSFVDKKMILIFGVIFNIISICTSITLDIKYEIWAFLYVCLLLVEKHNISVKV